MQVELPEQHPPPSRLSRKGKERDNSGPQPTDLDEKIMALRRRNAAATRPRDKSERDRSQLQHSQMLAAQQRPPQKVLSQSPPQSSSYREKERNRELSPKVSAADARHQISLSQSPSLSPRRPQQPHIVVSRPQPSSKDREKEADHEEFSRKLRISSSPRPHHSASHCKSPKLFDPHHDPIPTRRSGVTEDHAFDGLSEWERERERERERDRDPRERESTNAASRGNLPRQLFDHRKDDPVRFSVLARPQIAQQSQAQITSVLSGATVPRSTSKHPPNDHVSASSTSSYAASISSSAFTLSSTTDGSSASSALFEGRGGQGQGNGTDDSGNSVFSLQLKKLYRALSNLETKIKQEESFVGSSMEDGDAGMNGVVLLGGKEKGLVIKGKGKEMMVPYVEPGEVERERWKKIINDHKELAEISHNLLEISLSPSVPASLRNIPTKYNIIVRLWTYGFHKLLESLRRASFSSPLALEHLQDFIYYAYSFYTGLLEEPILSSFRSGWLEALGDLARYRMAVAAMVGGGVGAGGLGGRLTSQAVSEVPSKDQPAEGKKETKTSSNGTKSLSAQPAARIDDSPSPSIGVAAARLMDVEPEKERWRQIAREWYGAGLAEQPGTGKLHHHLGLLEREVEDEELRGCYHFVKSLTTLHPFPTSRESILPLFSQPLQARRASPDSRASDLFVLLHGMLFTNIQLDSFNATMARFIERLAIEGAEERVWLMMAVVNIGAILEYGKAGGIVRRFGGLGTKEGGVNAVGGTLQAQAEMTMMRVMAKKVAAGVPGAVVRPVAMTEEGMDVDDEGRERDRSPVIPAAETASDVELPPAFKYALQLTFAMLSFVLKKPLRKPSQYAGSTLNPYLTIILTFLATLLKHRSVLTLLERSVPWEEMAEFLSSVPRKLMISQGLMVEDGGNSAGRTGEPWMMLTSGCTPPLPEDWCMRGMEWVGRRVFERGYWKSGEEIKAEMDVLSPVDECGEGTDGRIEDDDDEEGVKKKSGMKCDLVRRWVRIVRCAVGISDAVEGFRWVEGSRVWRVEGVLKEKVREWREEENKEREEEERRRTRRWADDAMDIDEEEESISEESEEDGEDDPEEIINLKARRRYLKSLLQNSQHPHQPQRRRRRNAPKSSTISPDSHLSIIPGYTILVFDTNILLSSLSLLSSLIESHRWTVVIPLPVITELDGLASPNGNQPQLAEAAQAALAYVSSHLKSHALSLKVQTSRGNYLTSLSIRTEELDFAFGGGEGMENKGRNMDDLILKTAIWQDEHWVDRSALLSGTSPPKEGQTLSGTRVVLLTLDRNLRLKALSRQLPAAGEKDLAGILAMAT